MTTTVYLVRHGQVYNPNTIIYGRLPNFGLSDIGKKQIEETAAFLQDKHITVIFSSPLLRAQQTAKIICKKIGLAEIHTTEQISEVKTSYQGKKFSSLDNLQSEVYLKPLDPSDETIEQIATRMKNFITEITTTYAGKNIVVCSHGDPIMILRVALEKRLLELNSFKGGPHYIQHGEVYKILVDGNTITVSTIFKPNTTG